MTDNAAQKYHSIENVFCDYLVQVVGYIEAANDVKNPTDGECLRNMESRLNFLAKLLCGYSIRALSEDLVLPQSICSSLLEYMEKGKLPPLELLLYIFHMRKCHSHFIRLQNATVYVDLLVVFADSRGRVDDCGVRYHTGVKFVDGDQDILLGIAKKRFADVIKRGAPMMITANWNPIRKRWHLCDVFQF